MTTTSNKKQTKRVYGGLSEEARVLDRRERFLEAGLEIFGTVGLRGATVRALCREAGLTERYFYESFSDTEALFCAVYEKQLAGLQLYFATEIPKLHGEIDVRVGSALNLYFSLIRDHRLVRVLHLESMVGSKRVIDMHHNNVRLYIEVVAQWIRIDNPDLQMSNDVVSGVAMAINGACNSLAVEWMLSGYAMPQESIVQSCSIVVLGIMRELRSRNLAVTDAVVPTH